jgi:hypothetical protein
MTVRCDFLGLAFLKFLLAHFRHGAIGKRGGRLRETTKRLPQQGTLLYRYHASPAFFQKSIIPLIPLLMGGEFVCPELPPDLGTVNL